MSLLYIKSHHDAGQITGWYDHGSELIFRGFIRDENGFTSFDVRGAVNTTSGEIHNPEAVAGEYILIRDDLHIHGFIWSPTDSFTFIDRDGVLWPRPKGINDAGVVAGTYSLEEEGGARTHGFLWQND